MPEQMWEEVVPEGASQILKEEVVSQMLWKSVRMPQKMKEVEEVAVKVHKVEK